MADHPWFGATRQDRYFSPPDYTDLTLAVTLTRKDGQTKTFQTGLAAPTGEHAAAALDVLKVHAIEWFEETK